MTLLKNTVKVAAYGLAGLFAVGLVLAAFGVGDDEKAAQAKATSDTPLAVSGQLKAETHELDDVDDVEADTKAEAAPAEPKASDTQRVARKIAREYHAAYGPQSGYETSAHKLVTRFGDDLDPWDGSLTVETALYPDPEGEEFATEIGASVLSVGFPLGLCKVDVLGSDGSRLAEHESQGPGC